jgi:hypothetical protein
MAIFFTKYINPLGLFSCKEQLLLFVSFLTHSKRQVNMAQKIKCKKIVAKGLSSNQTNEINNTYICHY